MVVLLLLLLLNLSLICLRIRRMIFLEKFLLPSNAHYRVGWRVGVWLSDPKTLGLRKLRPRVELQLHEGAARERWQRSRNETSGWTGR